MSDAPECTVSVELFSNEQLKNSTVFILGATGCGKSVLTGNLLRMRPRFVVLDTRDEYPPEFFGRDTVVCKTLSQLTLALNSGKSKIILRPTIAPDDFELISVTCFQLCEFQKVNRKLPPITFAMDELNKFVTSQTCPNGLKEIIQRGRGHKIEKIFGAQWFNQVPTFVRDTFSEMYVFRHTEPRGLAMLENYGFDSHDIKTLPPHHCCHMLGGIVKQTKLVAATNKNKR